MRKRQGGFMVEILMFWVFLFVFVPVLVWAVTGSARAGGGTFLVIVVSVVVAIWIAEWRDESTPE